MAGASDRRGLRRRVALFLDLFLFPVRKSRSHPALRRLLDVLLASSARKKITRNSPRLRVPTCPRAGPPHVSSNPSQPGAGARVPRRRPPAARPRRRTTGMGHLREVIDFVGSSQKFQFCFAQFFDGFPLALSNTLRHYFSCFRSSCSQFEILDLL